MKKISLIVLAIIAIANFSIAQSDCNLKKNPELKKEHSDHYNNKVYPILKAARNDLDNNLSADDLATLRKYRTESTGIGEARKAIHQEMKKQIKAGKSKEEVKTAFSTQLQENRQAKMAIRKNLRPLSEKNSDLITSIMKELKPQREQWKQERKAITGKYYTPEEIAACKKEKLRTKSFSKSSAQKPVLKYQDNLSSSTAQAEKRKHARHVTNFLLWDGKQKKRFAFDEK